MDDYGYSKMYPTGRSDLFAKNGSQRRKSTPYTNGSTEMSRPNPRRFTPAATNYFTRETAADLHNLPLDQRFAKVYQMMQRSDVRDVQEIFQLVIEAIFGYKPPSTNPKAAVGSQLNGAIPNPSYVPVSLCDITTDYRTIYDAGHTLLNTDGPVMKFLLAMSPTRGPSSHVTFNFPVACLPYGIQNSLENGIVPPWYRDKVLMPYGGLDDSTTVEPPEFITMSAFDFFFAHFAYHLVNPDIRTNNPAHPQCLYLALVDNYSEIFFNPSSIMENQRLMSTASSSGYSRRSFHSLLAPAGRDFGFDRTQEPVTDQQRVQPTPLATAENLESIINIFVEFWLNISGFSSQRYGRRYHAYTASSDRSRLSPTFGQSSSLYGSGKSGRRLNATHNVPTVFPPVCALQVFRQVIKAMHEFVYAPAVNPRNQKNLEASLVDMKRHILPQLIQRPLYDLLKTTMKKYPMDASFRYVYELWLTYIQPWRYENFGAENSGEALIINREQRWSTFITENLLFYSAIFQAFVDRMLRVDFSVPFNTLAVFRVAKVFQESDMYQMVIGVEDAMLSGKKTSGTLSSGLSPTKSAVRNHFVDLEDVNYRYVALTSAECVAKVSLLLRTLVTEQQRCERQRQERLNPTAVSIEGQDRTRASYWQKVAVNTVKSLFGTLGGPVDSLQLRPEELDRMVKQISLSIDYLSTIFDIDASVMTESADNRSNMTRNEFILDHDPSLKSADASLRSLARSRSNIRHSIPTWMNEGKVPYLVEPEKRLPRTWEFEFLIPVMNALSSRVNAEYGEHIIQVYNGRDLLSRLVHPLIEPPHHPATRFDDQTEGRDLPARINLRPLASKYLIGGLLFVWLFFWIFDLGVLRALFFMIALPSFLLLVNALLEPYRNVHE